MAISFMELARKRIVEWMNANPKITQSDVAREIGRDQTWVSRYKLGKQDADVDQLDAIARVFGHTLAELFDLRPDPKEQQLIDAYRALPPEKRKLAVAAIEAMVPEPRKTRRSPDTR